MVGILVHGDNHFIVQGPLPGREDALALWRSCSTNYRGAESSSTIANHKLYNMVWTSQPSTLPGSRARWRTPRPCDLPASEWPRCSFIRPPR